MEGARGRWKHGRRQADKHGAIKLLRLAVKIEPRNRLASGYYCQPAVNPDKRDREHKSLRQTIFSVQKPKESDVQNKMFIGIKLALTNVLASWGQQRLTIDTALEYYHFYHIFFIFLSHIITITVVIHFSIHLGLYASDSRAQLLVKVQKKITRMS